MPKDTLTEIITYINNYVHYKKIPGLAVGMTANGNTVFVKGFGVRQINDLYSRVNADTIFSIQSLTKSFTASALVHLAEHTDFNLDRPVIDYLPYFRTKSGAFHEITTRHILSHTAGFPEDVWVASLLDSAMMTFAKDMPEYRFLDEKFPDVEQFLTRFGSREDITRYFAEIDLSYIPGESWAYCTDAYVIAADILEKVSGLSWEAYVATHILNPLDLSRTMVTPSFVAEEENIASYYLKTIDAPIETPLPKNAVGAPMGFMYSTIRDLLIYLQAHMKSDERIMSETSFAEMQTPFAKRKEGLSYGLGWKIMSKDGVKIVSHAGGYPGVSSFAAMIPDYQLGIVLLANTDSLRLETVADKVMNMWLRKTHS
ncbi:serine hydrolase domain-containing protein [Lentibacillus sp. JNUCC-1]|uniref:serine hydrolase domain-containing protein n=1 Tax=Lentibacillus sp. JNUCC-1 TaxID=2654513 RepID=UPI0018D23FC9